jgi:FixJ family two-component response regulator
MASFAETQPIVFVVDDDTSVRGALEALLGSVDIKVKSFKSPVEFFQYKRPDQPSCLVLDVRLPGISGLEFQSQLKTANIHIPIVFMTGHGDVPMAVKAMKAGAVEFLVKPIRDQDMLDAVQTGLDQDRMRRARAGDLSDLQSRFEALSPREREIMKLVTSGLMNKQIAGHIGVSEVTVKANRGNLMRKIGAKSVADLVRMADLLNVR